MLQETIRRKIANTKISENQFAMKAGIRQATLSDYLNQKIDIRVSTLEKITKPLGIDVDDLLRGEYQTIKVATIKGEKYRRGDQYEGKEIALCFGSKGSKAIALVLINDKKALELFVY